MSKDISDELKAILANDTFLPDITLEEKAKIRSTPLTNAFLDIVSFYEEHNRLPVLTKSSTIKEKSLIRAFNSIKANPELVEELKPFDKHDLLNPDKVFDNEKKETIDSAPLTLDDILNNSDMLFDEEDDANEELFNTRYSRTNINKPDLIAKPKPCLDYDDYKERLEKVNKELESGGLKAVKFTHKLGLVPGDYFIYRGFIGLFVSEGDKFKDPTGKTNYRCRVIYNNQTEIDVLYLSLLGVLLRDKGGMKIITSDADNKSNVNGYVYILSTLSTDNALDPYRDNLYKIGSTNRKIGQRIANAEKSTTYLEAPVEIVAEVICTGNVVPKKLEKTIHRILSKRKLNVTLISSNGNSYSPKEWFVVPFETIKNVISRINNGTIHHYQINGIDGKLIKK